MHPRRFHPWLAIAALVLAAAHPARADWLATGQFRYTDRLYDLSGWTGTMVRPVREADVQIYDLTTLDVLASGATDSAGNFSIPVTDAVQRDIGVRVLASNVQVASLNFSVVDDANGNAVYSYHDATTDQTTHLPTAAVNFGTMTMPEAIGPVASTDWSSQIFNTYDMAVLAADWVASVDGARPSPALTIRWNPNNGRTGSSYSGGSNLLSLSDNDGYDDANILHEIGHYVVDEFGRSNSPGGSHSLNDDDQDPRLSWSEGFATFVSGAVLTFAGRPRPDIYSDRDSFGTTGGFANTFEPAVVGGSTNELAVTAAIYDLIDTSAALDATEGTDDDPLGGLQASVWAVLEELRVRSPANTQLEDFWEIWFSLGLGSAAEMATVFAAHNIDFAPDAQEPNGTPASATTLTVGAAYQRNSFYRSGAVAGGDEDWFRFTAAAGSYYVVEVNGAANSIFGRPDPEMFLFDPSLATVLAASDDPYDTTLNAAVSTSAQDMLDTVPSILWRAPSAGTYDVCLRHASQERNQSGRYGTYHIRVRTLAAPAPTISSVSAQRMLPGQTYQVLVVGTNFSRNATVATGNPAIVVASVAWIAPTALVATLTPDASVSDGLVSLSVTNPGGTPATRADAFEVAAAAQPPLAITEVELGTEAVEVRNFGTVTATLTGWKIRSLRPSSTTQTFTFPTFTLAPGATVVVRDSSGTDTATDLFDQGAAFDWPWVNGTSGDVSLLDDADRNVDFLRFVSSPVTDHAAPQGTGGAWMPPQFQSPAAGFTVARAESTALYRTAFGLSRAAPTMPTGAGARTNNVDPWEDNDLPRRAPIFAPAVSLPNLRISARPSGTDSDWFGFVVRPGDALVFNALFTHAAGNLNMELYPPGEESVPLLTATSSTNNETITLSAAQSTTTGGGLYRLRVFGVSGAVNTYALNVAPFPVVTVAASVPNAAEFGAGGSGQFTITRTGDLSSPLPVQYSVGGMAGNGVDYTTIATSATIAAGASTAPIAIVPVADALAEGSENVTLTLDASAAYTVGAPSSATVTIADRPVDAWRFSYFGGNPPLSGDTEDADGDDLENLLEYALQLDPRVPSLSGLPAIDTEIDAGTEYFTLTYRKDTTLTDIVYQVRLTPNLVDWSDLGDTLVGVAGGVETRKARVPLSDGRKYLRLEITTVP